MRSALLALLALAVPGGDWVEKVPDFRSAWPEPHAIGTAGPDFTLEDSVTGKALNLGKIRAGKRATLLLFLDENCSTCKKRSADLASSLSKSLEVKDTATLCIFTRNLSGGGARAAKAFAESSRFPAVPLLFDERERRAEVTLAYRVPVSPCAVVLDGAGKIAYFGLALDPEGSGLLPGVLAAVAAGKPLEGPAVRPPYG